jgi:hypothetical protein
MVSIVVSFVFTYIITLVMQVGTLAPPYHLNKATSTSYYAIHGGYCSYGFYCGVFSIVLSAAFSWTNWGDGAALSFKTIVYKATGTAYAVRGGRSNDGLYCGFTYVRIYFGSSDPGWSLGAALSFKPFLFLDLIVYNSNIKDIQ